MQIGFSTNTGKPSPLSMTLPDYFLIREKFYQLIIEETFATASLQRNM
jgi:hypothetical protein